MTEHTPYDHVWYQTEDLAYEQCVCGEYRWIPDVEDN